MLAHQSIARKHDEDEDEIPAEKGEKAQRAKGAAGGETAINLSTLSG